MADQDAVSLEVSLSQMLHLALGTPEVGAVNLNILHHFLHVLLHQINLEDTVVEYKDDDAARMKAMVESMKSGPPIPLAKSTRKASSPKEGDGKRPENIEQFGPINDRLTQVENDLAYMAEDIFNLREAVQSDPKFEGETPASEPTAADPSSIPLDQEPAVPHEKIEKPAGKSDDARNMIKSASQITAKSRASAHRTSRGSGVLNTLRSDVSELKTDVTQIKQDFGKVDTRLSKLEKIVSSSNANGSSNEPRNVGISSNATSSSAVGGHPEEAQGNPHNIVNPVSSNNSASPSVPRQQVNTDQEFPNQSQNSNASVPPATVQQHADIDHEIVDQSQPPVVSAPISLTSSVQHGNPPNPPLGEQDSLKTEREISPKELRSSNVSLPTSSMGGGNIAPERSVTQRVPSHRQISGTSSPVSARAIVPEAAKKVAPGIEPPSISLISSRESPTRPFNAPEQHSSQPPRHHVQGDETDIIRMMEALRNIEIMYGEAIHNLDCRVIDLEREMRNLNEKFRSIPCGPDSIQEVQEMVMRIRKEHSKIEDIHENSEKQRTVDYEKSKGGEVDPGLMQEIRDLVGRIQKIQSDIEQINHMATRLAEEKNIHEADTNALLEQIELLKTLKADKEDLEDALADKADTAAIKTKVSVDQFDATCDDLARGLENAVAKLSQQEYIWQQALDDVQREIDGKLDKIEVGPIREFVNNKLKILQDKLKQLAEKRREHEAAGTKKMLSDVQCISCDKNVVMKIEEEVNHRTEPMPCTRSIKPYLTYELDQVRKQQRRLPGRDMIQFNSALQEMGRRSKLTRDDTQNKSAKDHLCNRYCGGSHTITTPQQRVMRMGHFLAQWGLDAIQLSDGGVQGNDGKIYRGRPMPPSSASRKSEILSTPVQGEKPSSSSPEASKIISPRKSQTNQRRVSNIVQAPPKRTSRRLSETLHEEPHPSPRSEPEAAEDGDKGHIHEDSQDIVEPKSLENMKEAEDNAEDKIVH